MDVRFSLFLSTLSVWLILGVQANAQSASMLTDKTRLISVDSHGNQGNSISGFFGSKAVSDDGRYVAFKSCASNLVPGDTNQVCDAFVHDRLSGETTRVSISTSGTQGNGETWQVSLSGDGRYVAFDNDSTNLVPDDSNGVGDVFIHDRLTGETTRVSVDSYGRQGNGWSHGAAISGDGHYVSFESDSTNLVPGDSNGVGDVFIHDRLTGETTRVSVDSYGTQGNDDSGWWSALSYDGKYVAFESNASNLVSGDTNGVADVFVHDRITSETTRVSVDSSGNQGMGGDSLFPSISSDGRYVAFESLAHTLVIPDKNWAEDVFVHDRVTGTTIIASVDSSGKQGSYGWNSRLPSISADGRYVGFQSDAKLSRDDLELGTDVFLHDCKTGATTLISEHLPTSLFARSSDSPSISSDGRYVGFWSSCSTLVPGDDNDLPDVFVRGPTFTLDINSKSLGAGQPLNLIVYTGTPGNLASIWVIDINGLPTSILLVGGYFGLDGTLRFSTIVPPGLSGYGVVFRGQGIDNTLLSMTNAVYAVFQ